MTQKQEENELASISAELSQWMNGWMNGKEHTGGIRTQQNADIDG